VAAGSHELRITASGKTEYRQNITVPAGQEARVEAPLADLTGSVVVQTSPGAAVFLDDSRRGTADGSGHLAVADVTAGSHQLRVSAPGKKEYRLIIHVTVGEQSSANAELADVEKPSTPVGTVKENPKEGLRYVWIPPGTFMMGCSPGDGECDADEKPTHRVTITKGFWMRQTEVTVAPYRRFAGDTGAQMPAAPNFNAGWDIQDMPIVNVSWDDATAFCGWAGGRLPT
jgi:formylglycine-generating enzyme required for sulfatase activity